MKTVLIVSSMILFSIAAITIAGCTHKEPNYSPGIDKVLNQ